MAVNWKNSRDTWGLVTKSFHWLLALFILGQLALGTIAEEARVSPLKLELFVWHKSFGVTILLLVLLRAAWRLTNPPPNPAADAPAWEIALARLGHGLLYLLMFAVPLTGWWTSDTTRIPFKVFWLVPVPDLLAADREMSNLAGGVHGVLTKLLLVVVVFHVAAALRHHFFLHNQTLIRMLPWRGRRI